MKSTREEKLLAMVERKKNLFSEAPEDFRKQIFQAIRELDEKISGEEVELVGEGKKECQSGGREREGYC